MTWTDQDPFLGENTSNPNSGLREDFLVFAHAFAASIRDLDAIAERVLFAGTLKEALDG
jgi:hypothetical protein